MSIEKLSSTSARQLLASSPNVAVRASITLPCSVSLPTFIRQAYSSLFSPVAIRNDAGSISAATTDCPSSLTACCSVATGLPTGSGLSWQPLSSAHANAPKIISPIIGSSAFIKLPFSSSSRRIGAVVTVSDTRAPAGAAAIIPAGKIALAHTGI